MKNNTLANFLPQELLDAVKGMIRAVTVKLPELNKDERIQPSVKKLVKTLETEKLLTQLLDKQGSLEQLFSSKAVEDLLQKIFEQVLALLKNDESLLREILKVIVGSLKEVSVQVYDIISPEGMEGFQGLIRHLVPELLSKGIQWLLNKKQDLSSRISQAVEGALDNTWLIGKIIKWDSPSMSSPKGAEGFSKIIAYIAQARDLNPRKLENEIAKRLEDYLKSNSIGEIIAEIELKISGYDNLNSQLLKVLQNSVSSSYKLPKVVVQKTKQLQIKDILSKDVQSRLVSWIEERLIYGIVTFSQSSTLSEKQFPEILEKKLLHTTLVDLLGNDSSAGTKSLAEIILQQVEKYIGEINTKCKNILREKNIGDLL